MRSSLKTPRVAASIIVVMGGFLWISVAFLGENWSDQLRYVITLLSLLLTMVTSAALLVAISKGIGLLWDKWVGRMEPPDDQPPSAPDNPQQ